MEYLLAEDLDLGDEPKDILFLEPHELFPRQWAVDSFDVTWHARMEGVVSRFNSVSIFGLPAFYQRASQEGYRLVFFEDPQPVLDWLISLSDHPGVEIDSPLEGAVDREGNSIELVGGFLPYQVQGLNFMKSCERMVFYQHSTGTGKAVMAEGTMLWKREHGYSDGFGYDHCLYVVKSRNLQDAYGKLRQHTDLEAVVVDGSAASRRRMYSQGHENYVVNAEKFRDDTEALIDLVSEKKLLVIYDEIPTKYANKSTGVYRGTCETLYTSYSISQQGKSRGKKIYYPKFSAIRPSEVFFVGMSAMPIINSPEDAFNSIRIMDSRVFGSVKDFHERHVVYRDPWGKVAKWKDLDLMGEMMAHVVHQVDKDDPEIAKQFPRKMPPEFHYSYLSPKAQKLYSILAAEYSVEKIKAQMSILSFQDLISAIGVFQMICSNPRAVFESAQKFDVFLSEFEAIDDNRDLEEWIKKNRRGSEVAWKLWQLADDDDLFSDRDDKGNCTVGKMLDLREIIEGHDDKMIVFSTANSTLLPLLSSWLDEWSVTHVSFHGELSNKQSQEAKDRFRHDPNIKVFLSSDAGSDSIDLPEASLTVDYDHPWTDERILQRHNRQDRVDSRKEIVRTIGLVVPGTVEDRKLELAGLKRGYYQQVFKGAIAEQSAKMGKKELIYAITGERL